ncbi:hypothetical protein [Escherichia coli]|uniref:hypothetical protein n=1 Tax=Escherichia coli TaxID=562 RepID=UPI0030D3CE54
MKFDFSFSCTSLLLALLSFVFPFITEIDIELYDRYLVKLLETSQTIWLFLCALITMLYAKPWQLTRGNKVFWLWAVGWWIVLFGRSISWGRYYFPDEPRFIFRVISVFLIAGLAFPLLFSVTLRKEIAYRFRHECLSFWLTLLTISTFFIADAVEHHSFLSGGHRLGIQELIEELYESLFMIALFTLTVPMMKRDRRFIAVE